MFGTKVNSVINFKCSDDENRLNTLRALCILIPLLEQYGYKFIASDPVSITAIRAETLTLSNQRE